MYAIQTKSYVMLMQSYYSHLQMAARVSADIHPDVTDDPRFACLCGLLYMPSDMNVTARTDFQIFSFMGRAAG